VTVAEKSAVVPRTTVAILLAQADVILLQWKWVAAAVVAEK
jgi:hypothetical protein